MMDSNKKNGDTFELRKAQFESSTNQNGNGTMPTEPPPLYSETMQKPPSQAVRCQTCEPHSNAQNDKRFENWDDKATRLLIMKRLEMNEQFDQAKSTSKQEMLWNIILNDLCSHGYHFTIIEIIEFWEFQLEIYESIINGENNASWEFFEPMHRVFGCSSNNSNDPIAVPIYSPTVYPTDYIPVIPVTTQPSVDPNRVLETINATTVVPSGWQVRKQGYFHQRFGWPAGSGNASTHLLHSGDMYTGQDGSKVGELVARVIRSTKISRSHVVRQLAFENRASLNFTRASRRGVPLPSLFFFTFRH